MQDHTESTKVGHKPWKIKFQETDRKRAIQMNNFNTVDLFYRSVSKQTGNILGIDNILGIWIDKDIMTIKNLLYFMT